jgi:Family of unknown function (DUF6279)
MITTLSAITSFQKAAAGAARWGIIGAVALALTSCSTLRLGYSNAPQLSWWWLDGQVDFSSAQSPAVRQAIDGFFDWHRRTQLPELAGLLAGMQPVLTQPTSPDAACGWFARFSTALDPAVDRALLQMAELLPTLGEANFRHLEQRHAKGLQELRADYLQPDAAERRANSTRRALDRAEQIYGPLDEAQRRVISAGLATSPFEPELWLAERQRRQADTVGTLRRLVAERAERDQRIAALRALVERTQLSPDPAYRAYQRRLTSYNCEFAARIHNATTPAQRLKAQQRLKGWEEDLRALISPG